MVILRVGLLVGEVNVKPLSHDENGATKATWPQHDVDIESRWRWRCRGDVGHCAMLMPSHAGNAAAMVTLAATRCRC
jgi:hypothetical protein